MDELCAQYSTERTVGPGQKSLQAAIDLRSMPTPQVNLAVTAAETIEGFSLVDRAPSGTTRLDRRTL
jgi:hypothetical protein